MKYFRELRLCGGKCGISGNLSGVGERAGIADCLRVQAGGARPSGGMGTFPAREGEPRPAMAGMADISDCGGNQQPDLSVIHEENPEAEARCRTKWGGLPLTNLRGGNIIISVRISLETYLTGGRYDRRKNMEGNYKICHSIVFGKFISAVL